MTGNFTDPADIQAFLSQADTMQGKYDGLAQRCLEHSDGKYLPYVGTAATARDLAALADALDGPGSPVNYIGLSYGTILGAWFINSEYLRFSMRTFAQPCSLSLIQCSLRYVYWLSISRTSC